MKKFRKPKPLKIYKDESQKTAEPVMMSMEENINILKELFQNCSDVVFRKLKVGGHNAYLLYIDGLIDTKEIETNAVKQLLNVSEQVQLTSEKLMETIISVNQVEESDKLDDLVNKVLDGDTGLIVDRLEKVFIISARGGSRRSVTEPETETSIRGPREGFTESLRVNTALVRQKIRSSHLKMVPRELGTETQTAIAILYLENIAQPTLVEEVLERIGKINIDGVLESAYVEELIEDNPWSPFPQIQNTEKPDTVAANLLEGKVSILINGTPFALILPATFWQFLQASEDYYQRFHISIFLRWLRLMLIFLALELPAFYIATTTYHQEMIPTNLLYSIAASREAIPFPAFVEAMIMELAFEALREAGLRLPKVIGQAVSILGALVIGTAAVDAGIVSAPMVIIVSITGIASFTIPRYHLSISIRLLRFPLMFLASVFGMFGIVIGSIVIFTHLCKLRSFGVPYFAPLAPLKMNELKDVFIRAPWWAMKKRPTQTVKGNVTRQKGNPVPRVKQ